MRAREFSSSSSLEGLGHAEGSFMMENTSSFTTSDPLKKNKSGSFSSPHISIAKANLSSTRDETIAAMSSVFMIIFTTNRPVGMNSPVPFREGEICDCRSKIGG